MPSSVLTSALWMRSPTAGPGAPSATVVKAREDHNHFIDLGLVAAVEDWIVRLLANATVAVTFEAEQSRKPV